MENQEPLIVIGPWFVTDAFIALRPLTFKLPVLTKLRLPNVAAPANVVRSPVLVALTSPCMPNRER